MAHKSRYSWYVISNLATHLAWNNPVSPAVSCCGIRGNIATKYGFSESLSPADAQLVSLSYETRFSYALRSVETFLRPMLNPESIQQFTGCKVDKEVESIPHSSSRLVLGLYNQCLQFKAKK
eukprot:gb/GECG01015869.1/.p1 GENE.gb/GECG01015869.1/~~gb/GECG01015869.1/.p1  ORF type:complete len:122 (+),score=6.86 gb/GECG01015869.1/:1-366(+)